MKNIFEPIAISETQNSNPNIPTPYKKCVHLITHLDLVKKYNKTNYYKKKKNFFHLGMSFYYVEI